MARLLKMASRSALDWDEALDDYLTSHGNG